MMKEKHSKGDSIDKEILSKGKEVIKDFDDTQEVYIEPKGQRSKLISIRLPLAMISNLRVIAAARGDVGYQQIIKTYIAEGLDRDNQRIQSDLPLQIFSGDSFDSVSHCSPLQPPYEGESGAFLIYQK